MSLPIAIEETTKNAKLVFHGGHIMDVPEGLRDAVLDFKHRLKFTWQNIADRIPADQHGTKPSASAVGNIIQVATRGSEKIIKPLAGLANFNLDSAVKLTLANVPASTDMPWKSKVNPRHQAEDAILEAICIMSTENVMFIAKMVRHITARE
jgi:hypothetical protein